jgi:hypothetical protein
MITFIRVIRIAWLGTEICISGMATSRRHSFTTQQIMRERRREHGFIMISFKKDATNN